MIFLVGHRRSPPLVCRHQSLPNRTDYAIPLTVSSAAVPLFQLCLFCAVARLAVVPEHRRLPWPPSSLAPSPSARTRGTRALLVARGCHLGHQLLPYRPAAPRPHPTELRPPSWSTPRSSPAAPAHATSTIRSPVAAAPQRAQPRKQPWPETAGRRSPPCTA